MAKDRQGDAYHEVINPSHHLADVLGGNTFGSDGQAHDYKKGLKTSTALITKQPTLPSRLSTIGTMLISRNFQIRRSNRRSINSAATVKSDHPFAI
ncbi:hypothetical protein [Synechococcus sp. WH 8109]|uniref:hypothetical protein n=1 Tax=Synechococcus sp. WH 8109 TaxID=166314 RepID=UPI00046CC7B5|nr:hypothetical protein [Synechococcus sp. WH 8109]